MTSLYYDVFKMPFSNVQNRLHVHLPEKFGIMRI
jgi:hypothetical protein